MSGRAAAAGRPAAESGLPPFPEHSPKGYFGAIPVHPGAAFGGSPRVRFAPWGKDGF